jgi:hypothetical protein
VKNSKVNFKRSFLYPLFNILLILSLLLFLPACNSDGIESPDGTTQPQPTGVPSDLTLALTPVPDLVNPGELTVTFNIYDEKARLPSLQDSSIKLEFYWTNTQGSYSEAKGSELVPIDEVMVCGDATWEGNAFSNLSITRQIVLPREGVWEIRGILSNPEEMIATGYIKVAVGEGTSAIMYTDEFYASPLAYLGNISYGEIGEKYLNKDHPVVIDLDISKAPQVGEQAVLTYRIKSLYEVADFTTHYRIYKRTEGNAEIDIPIENVVLGADLTWEGDLILGKPVVVTSTVVFPEAGDWKIGVYGNSKARKEINYAGYSDYIWLNITDVRGSYGWEERRTRSDYDESQIQPIGLNSEGSSHQIPEWPIPEPEKKNTEPYVEETSLYEAESIEEIRLELASRGATELVDKRSQYSETYKLPDGTHELLVSLAPIRYKDAEGAFQLIDNQLSQVTIQDQSYFTNSANSFKAYFPAEASTASKVRVVTPEGDEIILDDQKEVWAGNQVFNVDFFYSCLLNDQIAPTISTRPTPKTSSADSIMPMVWPNIVTPATSLPKKTWRIASIP